MASVGTLRTFGAPAPLTLFVRVQRRDDRIVYDFKDKTYLITGGTSGMGLAAAKQISNGGGRVIITGLDPQRLHTARQELGSDSVVLENDSGSPTTGTDLARHVEKIGRLDGLWLNAAIARIGPLEEIDISSYNQIMDINVRGPLLQLAALSPLLNIIGVRFQFFPITGLPTCR
jgi:NAD(P)-dependent dehydrogenase (short-subunit alcohol dehydrogenase family)